MLFYEGRQILEGIDSIDVLIQSYLNKFFKFNIHPDPLNRISLYHKTSHIPNDSGSAYKVFYYLHISGEMINPELNILDTIAKAISILTERKLRIYDIGRSTECFSISKEFIRDNLLFFITGISLVEFCFDFKPENIKVSESARIIEGTNKAILSESLKHKLRQRNDFIITEDETTVYSNDYDAKHGRKSTLKLYDREKWLLKKITEYPTRFIRNNPYKKRIEFVLQNRKSPYLNLNNFDGNYYEVMERFMPYLATKYKKYFLNKVNVNTLEYKYFDQIYSMAEQDSISRNNELQSNKKIIENDKSIKRKPIVSDLLNKIRSEKRKKEKNEEKTKRFEDIKRGYQMFIKDYPDSYYIDLNIIPYHTLLDMKDASLIDKELSDDDFIFYKDSFITPLSLGNIK
jgi:hypothetical protein